MKLSLQHWVIHNITDTSFFSIVSIHDTYCDTYHIMTKYHDTYREKVVSLHP